MQSKYRYLLSCIAVTILFLSACGEEKKEDRISLRSVKSTVVTPSSGSYTRQFSGLLRSSQESTISFKVSGTVQEIRVNVGDFVKKADVLATLDTSPYLLKRQQAEAALSRSEAEKQNSDATFSRTKRLYEDGNVSASDLDNARAAATSAKAALDSNMKSLELARLDLKYTNIISENDCAVGSIYVEEGENVTQGQPVFFMTCGDDVEVQLDIPESVIGDISRGMPVNVTFPALPGKTIKGSVRDVGATSVPGSTTFPVTVLITDKNQTRLTPGLSANVEMTILRPVRNDSSSTSVVVPIFAVSEDPSGRFVYLLDIQSPTTAIARRQPVNIGDVRKEGIEIVSGVAPGDRIVTAGVSVLRDGLEVRYTND